MAEEIQVTAEGYRRLEETLQKERQRHEDALRSLADTLDDAMDLEDRNLQAAQFDLPGMEARILELEDVLTRAVIVEAAQDQPEQVALGSLVVLQDETHDREVQVQLVSAVEVDALAGGAAQVSEDSPVGKALLGRRVGESFEVELGSGPVQYTVRNIASS
ncbi:transcription elongation factor GreAB [Deinococcus metallilatus]|uniref:Transcription elongation factor GreA n=1 Tax=Deinococcus metallilatus TaxID=1211322 RepID=A0AAJ5F6M3_9DEIO|nr:GreA/GreB family elongation factor [Deinococcus metallilatus]MBB5296759.1 transcription elongation factor GreA [Deinococcus metallilatus]QBY09169.1 transcription elongation factor GreAB [Deinococcus metallilatus]RXJ09684.1 transcription elongation factor GreAB [Deinococcus metallilatus]TLK24150.1 transcription elongation factor GreAB [Deinococcus metallilatus]GMA13790.1 transcription elongation factor [Deinococcus metallilatus]